MISADAEPNGLWLSFRDHGDAAAREALVLHYAPLARIMAAMTFARRTHGDVEFDDYLQLARVGLIEAVDRFDPGKGVLFRTFAAKRIRGAVLDGLVRFSEKHQQIAAGVRLREERVESLRGGGMDGAGPSGAPTAASTTEIRLRELAELGLGLALGILLEDTGMLDTEAWGGTGRAPSPEISYFKRSESEQLQRLLAGHLGALSGQQQQVIRAHYLQEIAFTDIADRMGLTRGRISQIHRQALTRLRELLPHGAASDVLA